MDRLGSILLGCESIRDVIAFPKNKKFQSLVDGSPTKVEQSKLQELQLLSPGRGGARRRSDQPFLLSISFFTASTTSCELYFPLVSFITWPMTALAALGLDA